MTTPVNSYALHIISEIIGWTYFVAWSLSFYPQVWENFRRKSVIGLSFDFLGLNIIGHSSYLVFNCVLLFSPYMRWKHTVDLDYGDIPVEINDVVFSIHAVVVTAVTIFQCFIYERGQQKPLSVPVRIIVLGLALSILTLVIVSALGMLDWYFFIQCLGFIKIGVSTIKYVPQAWLNFRRKSTVGWSIGNILLDFTGGCLSIVQMVIIAINKGDWSAFYSNVPKFALGQLSMAFSVLFIVQHYCLYRRPKETKIQDETETTVDGV
ncbi:cystinosin [Acrasis kona]|uniref:Cystinosin homolog n=1 Tax=Acrasis kona TaxID=1008807 RepID=A0AAW2YJ22_9EUKA